jgi:hypothetical protein
MVTDALALGIITPATIIAGILILRRAPLGYLIACSLLVLEMLLAPMIAAQMISQVLAGVTFSTGQIVGPIAGFSLLGLAAIAVTAALLRAISDSRRCRRQHCSRHIPEMWLARCAMLAAMSASRRESSKEEVNKHATGCGFQRERAS